MNLYAVVKHSGGKLTSFQACNNLEECQAILMGELDMIELHHGVVAHGEDLKGVYVVSEKDSLNVWTISTWITTAV